MDKPENTEYLCTAKHVRVQAHQSEINYPTWCCFLNWNTPHSRLIGPILTSPDPWWCLLPQACCTLVSHCKSSKDGPMTRKTWQVNNYNPRIDYCMLFTLCCNYASRRSRMRDTIKLTVCVCVLTVSSVASVIRDMYNISPLMYS